MAIGSPFGNRRSVSTGIVSAVSLYSHELYQRQHHLLWLKTDAANPGITPAALVNDQRRGSSLRSNSLIEEATRAPARARLCHSGPLRQEHRRPDHRRQDAAVHPYAGRYAFERPARAQRPLHDKRSAPIAARMWRSVVEDGPAAKAGIREGRRHHRAEVTTRRSQCRWLIVALRSSRVGEGRGTHARAQ